MRDENDPQLGVTQADRDECLRVLGELIERIARSRPPKTHRRAWRALLGNLVVTGFDFRMLCGRVGVVRDPVLAREDDTTIRIDFMGTEGWPLRSRFTIDNDEWRLSSFQIGCPVCLAEAIYEDKPCEFCDGTGYHTDFLPRVPRPLESQEIVARLGGHTTCPWCKRVNTHEMFPTDSPASDWNEVPFREGRPLFVCEGCVYDVYNACIFRQWAVDPNRAVVQQAATVEGMAESQFRRQCLEHQIALWDEGTLIPKAIYLQSYQLCKVILNDMVQGNGR